MGRINTARLLLGGIVAGVIANGLDYVTNAILMKTEMDDMITRLNLDRTVVEGAFVTWIVVDFVWGILLVFAYAAMRTRFGPGPKTAVVSGVTLWLAVCAVFAGLSAMGIFTQEAFLKNSGLSLITVLLASLAGAAIYKEE